MIIMMYDMIKSNETRKPLDLRELNFLDIVLIRSKIYMSGIDIDYRIATGIKYSTMGLHIPNHTILPKYDRIGFIILPNFIEKSDFNLDNIEVIHIITPPLPFIYLLCI